MYNNKAQEFGGILAAHQQQVGNGGGYPFLYPTPYMPAQTGLAGNNSDMGSLIAMFAGPLMGAMAGPENFMPNLMPGQALMDQYAMRNYQRETLEASLNIAQSGRSPIEKRLLGLRSAVTDDPVSPLNREQAATGASVLAHPIVKALAGGVMGPETVEAALYGSRGDPSMLAAGTNKIGYFRSDPTGKKRMTAESLTGFTESLYADLYEPKGNLDELEADARKERSAVNPMRNQRIEQSQQKLKELANMETATIVSDEDVVSRMLNADDSEAKISRLYRKYKADGTAVTAEQKAKELVKFERAVEEAGVLDSEANEATIGQLRNEAERAPVKRMRGFMAGQVATMQQQLFEEGRLPQSLGDMSAEERFNIVGKTERDDETMQRLARKMARTELERDSTFKDLSSEQQERLIEAKMPEARQQLEKTEKEAQKFAAGDRDAMSAEDLEKQGGMNLLTVDADAKRTGQTLEKYSGALAAVRQIFGDNGNPNAPVPMLIKTMNALTNNAMGQFEPGRVEAELRKMQMLAKETGTGLEQLAEISTNVTNQGRMFGLNDATAMQATSAVLAATRVAQQDGTFSSNRFGSMNKGEYTDNMGKLVQAGAASDNAKAMAAMVRMYDADPAKYAGTEMERAVEAYRDPNSGGRYIDPDTGEEKNLYQDVGRDGPDSVRRIVDKAGGDQNNLNIMMLDPLTEEKAKDNKIAGFMTQQYEVEETVSNFAVEPVLEKKTAGDAEFQALSAEQKDVTYNTAGRVVSRMLADTAQMTDEDRRNYFKKELEPELEQQLIAEGVPPAEAASRAKKLAAEVSDPTTLEALRAEESYILKQAYGMNSVTRGQNYGKNKSERIQQEDARAAAQSAARADADLGYEGTPVQRASDYLAEIGDSGENFTMSGLMEAIAPKIKDTEMGKQYAKELDPAFRLLAEKKAGVFVTEQYIDELREDKNYDELKKLAKLSPDQKILSGRELEAARDKEMRRALSGSSGELSDEKVNAAYRQYVGGNAEGLTTEQKMEELRASDKYKTDIDHELREAGSMTEDQLVKLATGAKGQAREGREQDAEDLIKAEAGLIYGKDKDRGKAAVSAIFRDVDVDVSAEQLQKFQELTEDSSEAGKQKLLEEIDDLAASGKQKEELTTLLQGRQAATKFDLEQAGVQPSMTQTADGAVDKTNIEANTVILSGVKYVDGSGNPMFTGQGGTGGPATANDAVRERANAIVDEHYSKAGMFGNSSAFTDEEVDDATARIADELKIPREDAKAIMQSIQAERAENINWGSYRSDSYTKGQEKKRTEHANKAVEELVAHTYSQKTTFSEEDTATAVQQLRRQTGIGEEEAKKLVEKQVAKMKPRRTWAEWWAGEDDKKDTGPEAEKKEDKPKEPPTPPPAAGSSGPSGDAGVAGPSGDAGVAGPSGAAGPAGASGAEEKTTAEVMRQYEREVLGVPEEVTPAQQAVIDRVSKDPTGKTLEKEMTSVFDASTREAILTLPDDAAVELFDKFTPEAQKKGLEQLAAAKDSSFLTKTQRENASRLHRAISAREDATTAATDEPLPSLEDYAKKEADAGMIAGASGMSRDEALKMLAAGEEPLRRSGAENGPPPEWNGSMFELARMDPEELRKLTGDSPLRTNAARDGHSLPISNAATGGAWNGGMFELARMDPEELRKLTGDSPPPQVQERQLRFDQMLGSPLTAADAVDDQSRRISSLNEDASNIQLVGQNTSRQRGLDQDVEALARQLAPVAPSGGGPGGGTAAKQDQTLRVTGTLSLQGLQDVLLNARGQQSVPVEGSGAPIVVDPPNMYSSPQSPPQDSGYSA